VSAPVLIVGHAFELGVAYAPSRVAAYPSETPRRPRRLVSYEPGALGGRFVVEVIPVCPNPRQRPHHLSMTVRGWAAWVEHYGARPVREEDEA